MSDFETFLRNPEKFLSSQGKPLEFCVDFGRIGGELLAKISGKDPFTVTAYSFNTSDAVFMILIKLRQ